MKTFAPARLAATLGQIIAAMIITFACSKLNPAEPMSPPPTSHEFTWQLDSVGADRWQFGGRTLWGTSARNMYLGGYNSDGHDALWHYNGKTWSPIDLFNLALGEDIWKIDGVDSSDFVCVGNSRWGVVDHYKNGVWKEISPVKLRPTFNTIHEVSSNEMYLASADGILLYDGATWRFLLDSTMSVCDGMCEFVPRGIRKSIDGEIYFTSQRNADGNFQAMYLWMWDDTKFKPVDSLKIGYPAKFGEALIQIGNYLYSPTISGLYKIRWGQETRVFDQTVGYASGKINNIFCGGNRTCYHFNGIDWKTIIPDSMRITQDYSMEDLFYAGGTVFIAFNNGWKTIVLKGKQIPTQ